VSRDVVFESDAEMRSPARPAIEVVNDRTPGYGTERRTTKDLIIEEEVKVKSPRRSRIEREEQLKSIDQQREAIKRRREDRERRRRESEIVLGSIIIPSYTTPPSNILVSEAEHEQQQPASATSSNASVSPTTALRRKVREKSIRMPPLVPHQSTLSATIKRRLGQAPSERSTSSTAAASAQQDPLQLPASQTTAAPQAQPFPQAEDGDRQSRVQVEATSSQTDALVEDEDEEVNKTLVARGCDTALAYSSLKEKKIVDAFYEAIAEKQREREEREREEKQNRLVLASSGSNIKIGAPPKRPLSEQLMHPVTRTIQPLASSASATSGSPPKKRKLENGESASSGNQGGGTNPVIDTAPPSAGSRRTFDLAQAPFL